MAIITPMTLSFYKLRVGTNDFLLVDGMKQPLPPENWRPLWARRILDRRVGVGANGLILLTKPAASIEAVVYTAAGEQATAVDDAQLAMARYLFDSALAGGSDFALSIQGKHCSVEVIDSRHFRLSLGSPFSTLTHQAFTASPGPGLSVIGEVGGNTIAVTPVHLRGDAAIMFWRDTLPPPAHLREPLKKISGLERLNLAPIVVRLGGSEELEARIPRGERRDRTELAAAALAVTALNGFCGRYAQVSCEDARFVVQWLDKGSELMVSGTAEYVFEGTYFWDDETP